MSPFRHILVRSVVAPLLLGMTLGCREDATSPTVPESTAPASATGAAAQPLSFEHVSVGYDHSCGVATDGRAYCWGVNNNGALGDGTKISRSRPTPVKGELRFRQVNAGTLHTCGVTTDYKTYCWGYGRTGQLGNGSTNPARLTPARVAGGQTFRQVRAGDEHTCAITRSDVAFCWGDNREGALGNGTTTSSLTPVQVKSGLRWSQLSGGFGYTCGVTNADLAYCWGIKTLPDGTSIPRLTPTAIAGGFRFRAIEAGGSHVCAVSTADRLYCWGYNVDGEVGTGTTTYYYPDPVLAAGNRRYDRLNSGYTHSCAVSLAAKVFCWGFNASGQIGDGTKTTRLVPTSLAGGLSLDKVSAGVLHSCGVTASGRAYCWGENLSGQLGDGTTTSSSVPVAVAAPM